MQLFRILLFLVAVPFAALTNTVKGRALVKKNRPLFPAAEIIIDVQPFSDLPQDRIDYVVAELKKVYPNIELKKTIPLPSLAWYPPRSRYRADSLINYLGRQTPASHVTIGLTSKDISTTKDKFPDWGVMGLGFCPGNACMVSTHRLTKTDVLNQLFKVSIHELGHTQGLDHCPVTSCFMRDAEGRNPTNEEKEFCPKCKAFLAGKGWKF
jgi:archaemetzincin